MLTLEDIRQEKWGKSFYVLPGRQTTECAKRAKAVLSEINAMRSRAEESQKERAKLTQRPSNK